ncbi:MAG: pyridoxal phosphate-dependent decarboxylase family protein [Caulobacteraceae bacterium]
MSASDITGAELSLEAMRQRLRALEDVAGPLDPVKEQREAVTALAVAHAEKFLSTVATEPAFAAPRALSEAVEALAVPEQARNMAEILSVLEDQVDHSGVTATSPRFLGYIPGGGLYHAALGDYLAAVSNRYSGVAFAGPGAARVENGLVAWLAGVIGYPETARGSLASGGSIANLAAIVTARDAKLSGAAVEHSTVYLTDQAHHSLAKALHIAGLSTVQVRTVPVDARWRMRALELEAMIEADKAAGLRPWLVVGSAGTTNSGAVDPLPDIAEIARQHDLWFHVDGAYGGLFALCEEARPILRGIEQADSVTVDPHKTLFLPYGTGAVLVRDGVSLLKAFSADADYIENILDEPAGLSPADVSPELTRHFRGLRLWLPLQLAGVSAFRAAMSEKLLLARYFHKRLSEIADFEVGPEPDLSVVVFRYRPDAADPDAVNAELQRRVQHDGRIFISSTRLNGSLTLRCAILSFRTHLADIDETLKVLVEVASQMDVKR